jgi:hypothetical protein
MQEKGEAHQTFPSANNSFPFFPSDDLRLDLHTLSLSFLFLVFVLVLFIEEI